MPDRPTIYLSNWSSHRTPGHHGPRQALTIMAKPRRWEHGHASVTSLVPPIDTLEDVRSGSITMERYRALYEQQLMALAVNLAPGLLTAMTRSVSTILVEAGDTLCCACSREDAAAGRCHRAWAAAHLHTAGWRVVLDGEGWTP